MRHMRIAALCGGLLWGFPAEAQILAAPNCHGIAEAAARLACFDAAVAAATAASTQQPQNPAAADDGLKEHPRESNAGAAVSSSPSRWRVEIERDLMGGPGRSFVTQTAVAFNGPAPRDPFLTLRCGVEGNQLEILFNPQIFLGRPVRSSDSDDIKIRIRFDEERPFETYWSPSAGRNAAFASDPRRFYERLRRQSTVVIEAEAHGTRDKVAAEFSVAGLAEAALSLAACLPELPSPEITRQYGVQTNLIDFRPRWMIVPRAAEGPLAQQRMLVTHGEIDADTGNQAELSFWCDGPTMSGRVRFPQQLPAQITGILIMALPSPAERLSNVRRIDPRTIALPDPRKIVRLIMSEGHSGILSVNAIGREFGPFRFFSLFPSRGMSEDHVALLQPCMHPPRPPQRPQQQR